MRIENAFEVDAAPEAAWELLMDVPRIVPCMPGARLAETVGDDAWKAQMRVKLGPMSLRFDADVRRTEADVAAQRVVLDAVAREARGRGHAQATITSSLSPREGGGTRVDIVTDVALAGAVAQYGRGVVADVSNQLVADFAACLGAQLSAGEAPAAVADGDGSPVAAAPPPPPQPQAPALSAGKLLAVAIRGWLRRLFRRTPAEG